MLIYLPRKDERLSRPGRLTYSGRFTYISGHPSSAGRAQDSESLPVRDRRSTTVPRNQHTTDLQIHLPLPLPVTDRQTDERTDARVAYAYVPSIAERDNEQLVDLL